MNDEKLIRAKLAAMTDAEILVHYRREHGNPYMPLSTAKELHRFAFRYLHNTLRAEARRKGIPPTRRRPGRAGANPAGTTVGR